MKLTTQLTTVSAAALFAHTAAPTGEAFSSSCGGAAFGRGVGRETFKGGWTGSLSVSSPTISRNSLAYRSVSDTTMRCGRETDRDCMRDLMPTDPVEAPKYCSPAHQSSEGKADDTEPSHHPESCLMHKVVRPTQTCLENVLTQSLIAMIRGAESGNTATFMLHALNLLAVGALVDQLESCFGSVQAHSHK